MDGQGGWGILDLDDEITTILYRNGIQNGGVVT
jgi:hypothetical protein